ncbi:MAG: phosphonate metabolism transcriptional regulator PhnF, partial [Pseudomonadota bacterium]
GKRAGGSMLPTEAELSRQFEVNRHTIRRALRALAEDGLVRAEQGRGTFVQDVGIDYLIGTRTRFSENIRAQDFEPGLEILGFAVRPAPADVAEMLNVKTGSQIAETQTRRFANDRPVTVSTSYYAGIEPRRFEGALRQGQSVTRALAEFGLDDYQRKSTIVSSRMPSASDAELLKQPRTRPILHVEALSVLPDGTPIELSRTRFASDRVQLIFESDGQQAS